MQYSRLMVEPVKGFERQTQFITSTSYQGKYIFEAALLVKQKKYKEAVKGLEQILKNQRIQSDLNFRFQIKYHIGLIYMRQGQYKLVQNQFQFLLKQAQAMENQNSVQDYLLRFKIISNLILLKLIAKGVIKEQAKKQIDTLLTSFVYYYQKLPKYLKIDQFKQFNLKLIGLDSIEDFGMITHVKTQNAYQQELTAIYKMLAKQYQQAKYYMINALEKWKSQKQYNNCFVCISFILYFNTLMGKDNSVYKKQLQKLQMKLKINLDFTQYISRINQVQRILYRIQDLKVPNADNEYNRSIPNMKATKALINLELNKQTAKIKYSINVYNQMIQKKQIKSKQINIYQKKIKKLQQMHQYLNMFQKDLLNPEKQEILYILFKYKFSHEIYTAMLSKTSMLSYTLKKILLKNAFTKLYMEGKYHSDVLDSD